MNTEIATIFTDQTAEYANLQSASPSIDFTDSPCTPAVCQAMINSPNFLVTAAQGQVGYYEIEFNLVNGYWGCNFSFGNSQCGVQIRQGIAHMIDKNSFTTNEAAIGGHSAPIDNPLPTTSGGGLPSPNPCGYDVSFPESGSQCIVGANGSVAYHLQASGTGANSIPWIYAPGSQDLNAAAQHFVNAGVATGFNATTSVLTGISAGAASNPPNFFIRNDDVARLDLGNSLAAQMCYLFTGSYVNPCTYLSVVRGPPTLNNCIGRGTCCLDVCTPGNPNTGWWMYTAAFNGPTFFDGSLYYGYNSRFVSAIPSIQPPNGPCSAQAVPTNSPGDYMYVCNPNYDSLSSQMEFAPCLTAPGDPSPGSINNGPGADCPGTTQLSGISAGIQAEAIFGAGVFTLPVFEQTVQFGFLNNGWSRDINGNGVGLPNHFTWLNTYNQAAPLAWTIRQGFSRTTGSVNPYIASSAQDTYIVNNVYDSLYQSNPLYPGQLINWMTITTFQLSNSSLSYVAPAHTLTTYRFTLRSDMFFQDGRPVTSYDVAFSYLSMIGSGAFLGTGAAPVSGITILGPHQFDIGVNSLGPFTLPNLTSLPIVPGRFWTNAGGSAWDNAVTACTTTAGCGKSQYTLSGSTVNCNSTGSFSCATFPASLMTVTQANVAATFDPIANHVFLGAGPYECGIVTSNGSGTCTPSGTQNPSAGQTYTLTRFGNGLDPASSISSIYFRSSGNTALWTWSLERGSFGSDFLNFANIVSCYGQPVNLNGPCSHWQQGIGNPGTGTVVGVSQVAIVVRFYGVNWVAPFDWQTNPPIGIGTFPPVLYEGSVTLNPASVVGCPTGYDC
jgi:ABC-type transport system substrate-binding protein